MTTMKRLTGLATVLLLLAGLGTGCSYNKFTTQEEAIKASWGEVENLLLRRHDLIPNLVEVVSGYATHERGTLDEVSLARNQAVAATSPAEQAQAENLLTGALSKLFANVERYPDLKAEGDFQRLENQLSQIENVIAMSRQSYNLTVQAYNNAVDTFPTNIVASFSGFADRPYLTAEESDRSLPEIQMDIPASPPRTTAAR